MIITILFGTHFEVRAPKLRIAKEGGYKPNKEA